MTEKKVARAVDRKGWPAGPWDGEPDRVEFRHAGFPCLIVRQSMGHLCGYVGVPLGHPWHGKGYDDVPARAHGGLTYAEECGGEVCHVPAPGEPEDLWWLGFDCAHAGDLQPGAMRFYAYPGGEAYKTVDYVRAEALALATQANHAQKRAAAPPPSPEEP